MRTPERAEQYFIATWFPILMVIVSTIVAVSLGSDRTVVNQVQALISFVGLVNLWVMQVRDQRKNRRR